MGCTKYPVLDDDFLLKMLESYQAVIIQDGEAVYVDNAGDYQYG